MKTTTNPNPKSSFSLHGLIKLTAEWESFAKKSFNSEDIDFLNRRFGRRANSKMPPINWGKFADKMVTLIQDYYPGKIISPDYKNDKPYYLAYASIVIMGEEKILDSLSSKNETELDDIDLITIALLEPVVQ